MKRLISVPYSTWTTLKTTLIKVGTSMEKYYKILICICMSLGFIDYVFLDNPKAYFTRDFIQKNQHIPLAQILLTRATLFQVGIHTFTHMTKHSILRKLIANPGKCLMTFTIGNHLDINIVNKVASLALRSPQRLHIHVGTARMTQWKKELKPKLKVRNLVRSPIVILSKVCKLTQC